MQLSTLRPLTEREAAVYLGVSIGTLRRWRYIGCAPRHFRVSNLIRYRREDLDAFIAVNSVAS